MSGNTIMFVMLALGAGIVIGIFIKLILDKGKKKNAKIEADDIIQNAQEEKKRIIKDAEISAKEIQLKRKEKLDQENELSRRDLKETEKRLSKREDMINKKLDVLDKRDENLLRQEATISETEKNIKLRERELNETIDNQKKKLLEIANISEETARENLMALVEESMQEEISQFIKTKHEYAKETAEQEATEILTMTLQRLNLEGPMERVVTTVQIPSDEMKGRIIGREGRNIRIFEKITGVDVIIDDTPGVIVLSCFDCVRREVARHSMEMLISDGRIHPARIEELVEKARQEVQKGIKEAGKKALYDLNIHNVHPRIVECLGRLKYRSSYGQNVLNHSIEVAQTAGLIAGQLKLDVALAQRAGLFHDIGKAVDQELEGTHPAIGMEIARRANECEEVINAIGAHHEDIPYTSLYGILAHIGDAVSASRPGARNMSTERYVNRLEQLEETAASFDGVDKAFAIQAGREIRVIVKPNITSDKAAMKIARDVAKKVEEELTYPGEVKVSVIRETRFEEYAR